MAPKWKTPCNTQDLPKPWSIWFHRSFYGCTHGIWKVPGKGVNLELQLPAYSKAPPTPGPSHTAAGGTTGPSSHWARSGIEPTSSWTLFQVHHKLSHNGKSRDTYLGQSICMIKRNKAYNNADTSYTHGWEDSTQNTAKFQQKCFFFIFFIFWPTWMKLF